MHVSQVHFFCFLSYNKEDLSISDLRMIKYISEIKLKQEINL